MTDTAPNSGAPHHYFLRAEWIGLAVTLGLAIAGSIWSQSKSVAQIGQNTKDIAELKGAISAMPERLARIEQKVDDVRAIEIKREGGSQ